MSFFKSSKLLFNSFDSHVTHAFELIYSNVWGPFYMSLDSYKYFVTFIYDFSRVMWVYLLKGHSEVFSCFKGFHTLISYQFCIRLKTF